MFHGSPIGNAQHSLLCIGSPPVSRIFEQTLRRYQSRVAHDVEVAYRRAQRESFDVYLTFDAYDAGRAVTAWRKIRRFDENTPLVIVGPAALADALEGQTRPGFDAIVDEREDEALLLQAIEGLLLLTGERSLHARQFAVARVCEEIEQRLAHLEQQILLSRQALARAQEHLVRAEAMRAFLRRGGTKSFFDRLWPDMFEEALQRSRPGM